MKILLIGYGEIGMAVEQYYAMKGVPMDVLDLMKRKAPQFPEERYDMLAIAFPYTDEFVQQVYSYADRYKPKGIIIFSTVPIGTTTKIPYAVHSPVEGKHPHLLKSIYRGARFVGGENELVDKLVALGEFKKVYKFPKPECTEAFKLLSTSLYGINIEFYRYAKVVCDKFEINVDGFKHFNREYNELYQKLDMHEYQRYILNPPEGNIGGHCVVPNAKLLDNQVPSVLLKEIYKDREGNK
jgi:UDP-N-acetyl-D-mannosaminuronate dehydrogenase